MRVTRHPHRYVVSCSPGDFRILQLAVERFEAEDGFRDVLRKDTQDTGRLLATYTRRRCDGDFMKIDYDRRPEEDRHDD